MTDHYVRNPELVAYSMGDRVHLLRPGRAETVIGPTDPAAIGAVLAELANPVEAATLSDLIDEDTAQHLVDREVIIRVTDDDSSPEAPPTTARPLCGHLLLGISGSVVAANASAALWPLLFGFAEKVDVIVTDAAARFMRPEVFTYLGIDVWTDDYEPRDDVNVPHIHLARSADLIVVWPTSAATLAKLAHGSCNDLLSLAITASEATTVLFPAMNHAMWTNAAVARNVAQLRADGYVVVEPEPGRAAADQGAGPLNAGAPGLGGFTLREILESVVRAAASETPSPARLP